ncbi:PREDICTED: elongation of very long chain fatty acids protein AAEL008004-like [Diuraphis noxia]|uniref:elongation of very long chain fatty acids protein AAEL008004-like n=1 Tax=Diuraphis noxia TaxID=143948 RepID=UPI0007639F14|nr:PREDICTED: elongation of very long chain fatty acids protein AAEL008004-like [Diuraphis noxia]
MANVTDRNFILEATNQFFNTLEKELVFDDVVDSWFLMRSPVPVFSIVAVYLLFILKIGPNMMKNREPYRLKHIMLIYNLFQTGYNAFILYLLFFTPGGLTSMWYHSCHPIERSKNAFLLYELNKGSWYFFISKVIDLLDTIFFVLRKKQSQVTFLHVYHHSNMVITCWAYLRFIKGEQSTLPGGINSFIHTIMYFYYFLAALGPQMQPYLWWKRYLTRMQIIQFVIVLLWYIGLVCFNCDYPKVYIYYMFANVTLFLYLFSLFYKKTYTKKPKTVKSD